MFSWWTDADRTARRALIAASLGWMLDAFDVMLYSLVLTSIIGELGLTKAQAGLLGSLTLVASAGGGIAFGVVADRWGRTRALMWSVLIYSVFTALCAFAGNLWQLALCRTLLGIGMGGEWASGAALVSETWPAQHRGKAFGFMQSSWAIGYALAAVVTAIVLPRWGWRAVFLVGILPALFALWVRARVEEPELWRASRRVGAEAVDTRGRLAEIFGGSLGRLTVLITLMNAFTLFGWWGLSLWVPAYLTLANDAGGIGLGPVAMSASIVLMQAGMWLGYVSFGFISDAAGRKRVYVCYLLLAAVLLPLYGAIRHPLVLFGLGPLVAFFGAGQFSGFGPLTAEIYPTRTRATAQGFSYNLGRIASALAPAIVGSLADSRGFSVAFLVAGVGYLAAALTWRWIPELQGRVLE